MNIINFEEAKQQLIDPSAEEKQWNELTVPEQKRRDLLIKAGLVCQECGKPAEGICDDCQKQFDFECERDYYEQRFYEDVSEEDHGEETIRIVDKATGELIDEFTTVSIHDEPTPEKRRAQ